MKEALQRALDALGPTPPECCGCQVEWQIAITAIKEALANEALDKMAENARELGLDYEPAQEPVAWAKFSAKGNIIDLLSEPDDDYTPLYTTPSQRTWVGLTEEEILSISADCAATHQHTDIHFARAIEAKLKDKNI
jgi:hypothetical protein